MSIIQNPILPGFNPDPSMVFVDGIYYIATSTFEWFPGVQIHKSIDLENWELASRPLSTTTLLDMLGNPKSAGVWAPCLSYSNGLFYLVYSNMKTWKDDPFKDSANYLTTSPTVEGDWSDPIYLNSSGFDASMFHDEDGRKWYLNQEWDHRQFGTDCFSGILIQEYDSVKKELIGEVTKIFPGTKRGLVEGPHLYKRNGYYYLLCAEGGTSYEHAESVSRSKHILGPYEVHPNELLISALDEDTIIQKTGHGSMCIDDRGDWYFAHLCGRPIGNDKRCILGRETSIQEIVWKDNWPYLKSETTKPSDSFDNKRNSKKIEKNEYHYTFHDESFLTDFQTLRIPYSQDMFSITKKPGYLTIIGKESLFSCHRQSLLARRQDAFRFNVETEMEFSPTHFQHMAGLIYRYDEDNQYYLYMTYCETKKSSVISMLSINRKQVTYQKKSEEIMIVAPVTLGIDVNFDKGQFYIKQENKKIIVGSTFDTTILSDEYADPMGFTGAFIGVCNQDLNSHSKEAYFKSFKYTKKDTID